MLARLLSAVFCLILGLAACRTQQPRPAPAVAYLISTATAGLGLPFSEAVRVGNLLFLSGQIGNRPGTLELAPGGIQGEMQQTMENIRRILEANGSSLDEVVKCTVMLDDIGEWPDANAVYVTFFQNNLPARSAFGADGLALGARVEVECIATVGVSGE